MKKSNFRSQQHEKQNHRAGSYGGYFDFIEMVGRVITEDIDVYLPLRGSTGSLPEPYKKDKSVLLCDVTGAKRIASGLESSDPPMLLFLDKENRLVSGVDLLTALVGAKTDIKAAIYRNLSPRVKQYLVPTVERLENGDAKDLIIERSRNIIFN